MFQPALNRSYFDAGISWFDRQFKYILLVIFGIQVFKGTALYVNPYARSHYLWNYDYNFIKRGLVGTLALFLDENDSYRMVGIIDFFSYLSYFVFLYALYRFILRYAQDTTLKVISLLLAASPLIIGIGALLGYYDALLLTILLLAFHLCNKPKIPVVPYIVLLVLAIMIHELAIIFVVPPLVYQVYLHTGTSQRKKILLIMITCLVCMGYLAMTYKVNGMFDRALSTRIDRYAPVLSTKSGQDFFKLYGNYAIRNNFLHDFKLTRLGMMIPFLLVYGFFGLVCTALVLVPLLSRRYYKEAFLYLLIGYAPFLVILVAWDIDRFMCLSCCTAFLNFLAITKKYPFILEKPIGRLSTAGVSFMLVLALACYYPISENYAEGETPFSINKQKALLQIPGTIIKTWLGWLYPAAGSPTSAPMMKKG